MPRLQKPLWEAHADDCVFHTFGPDACDCGHWIAAEAHAVIAELDAAQNRGDRGSWCP